MAIGSLQEMMQSNQTIINFTNHGNCSECGNCCTNMLPISDTEVLKIKTYIKKNHIKPHVMNLPLATPTIDMTCPFLKTEENTHRCMIYPVRPFICKHFICSKSEQQLIQDLDNKEIYEIRPVRNVRQLFFENK